MNLNQQYYTTLIKSNYRSLYNTVPFCKITNAHSQEPYKIIERVMLNIKCKVKIDFKPTLFTIPS